MSDNTNQEVFAIGQQYTSENELENIMPKELQRTFLHIQFYVIKHYT
jgi:hypothetical protein